MGLCCIQRDIFVVLCCTVLYCTVVLCSVVLVFVHYALIC